MNKVRATSVFLSFIGLLSCKTSEASKTAVVSDFGANDKLLNQENLPGDSRTSSRNAWWIDNKDFKVTLFKEFGGPKQLIDGETEDEIAKRAIKAANVSQDTVNGGKRLRAFHAKSQACFNGMITVLPTVLENEELRFGIFRPDDKGTLPVYKILGRFSNGNAKSQSDAVSDPRGFAIKVLNVKGEKIVPDMPEPLAIEGSDRLHQDFLGTNSPVFPNRNAKSYVDFHLKTIESEKNSLAIPLYLANPFTKDGFRTAAILAKFIDTHIGSLAEITYGSGGAFKMGDRAGKYWLRGCADEKDKSGKLYPPTLKPSKPSDDYLEDELQARLETRGSICMEMLVQMQRHPVHNPIEDPSVIWKDIPKDVTDSELQGFYHDLSLNAPPESRIRSTEFYPIARISMPLEGNQGFRSAESKKTCEGMFFNTWHTTSEHRPLGNINRVRLKVYRESWLFRQNQK